MATPTKVFLLIVVCVHSSYVYCQHFTSEKETSAQVIPQRFLYPGARVTSYDNDFPYQKRLLSNTDKTALENSRRISRPSMAGPEIMNESPLSVNSELVEREPQHFQEATSATTSNGNRVFQGRNSSLVPVTKSATENTVNEKISNKERYESDAISSISTLGFPTIRTEAASIVKTSFTPSAYYTQHRATKPQFFTNTNVFTEEEQNEFPTTKAQKLFDSSVKDNLLPSQELLSANVGQYQRKELVLLRGPNSKNHLPTSTVKNKIVTNYQKSSKLILDKSDAPEKRITKPVAQILRRYREDNADGSITWGFENDDGSYKEETIGNDCITRGKYGYIDPDGVRREYFYSQGLLCDKDKLLGKNENDDISGGYIDYSDNKVIFPNGDSIDLSNMVKNRARKPVTKVKNY